MKVYKNLRCEKDPTSIALGYFDGVHIGHEKVIMKAVSYKKQGLKPIVLTFQESPRTILCGSCERVLTHRKEKIKIFESFGLEALYIIDFKEVKDMTAESFVVNVLCGALNVKKAVCGFNYTFGEGGRANAQNLKALGAANDISVDIIEAVKYKNETVSATRIRKAIAEGDICGVKNMTKNL